MKKYTKIISMIAVLALTIVMTIMVTMALLADSTFTHNTMVVGNVDIEQDEYQRDEDGKLEKFEQDKPALPIPVEGELPKQEEPVTFPEIPGEYELYEDVEGVQDKLVVIKNTGENEAYVRTVIAFECPEEFDPALWHINDVGMTNQYFIVIDGTRYMVREYLYAEPLAPEAVSTPSLLQFYLDYNTTNEDILLTGEKLDILVLSQAVQVSGFEDARTALDAAFGTVEGNAATWFETFLAEEAAAQETTPETTPETTAETQAVENG